MQFTRRTIFAVLSAMGFPIGAKAAPEWDPRAEYWLPYMYPMADSFAALSAWLNSLPIRQMDGSPTAICESTGKAYVPHRVSGLARPGDEKIIEGYVAQRMQWSIVEAIGLVRAKRPEDVTIHWRQRLEFEICDYSKYDGAAWRFVQVDNWGSVTAYCRLTISATQYAA